VFLNPAGEAGVKDAAFSQFAKVSNTNVTPAFRRNETNVMGYSVRGLVSSTTCTMTLAWMDGVFYRRLFFGGCRSIPQKRRHWHSQCVAVAGVAGIWW
jgi:hypothetical protein